MFTKLGLCLCRHTSTLEAVCRAFGITLAQFFAEGDEPSQLTEEQRILFSKWSPLTGEQKRLLLDLMKTM